MEEPEVYNINSNNPEEVTAYPALHLSRYQFDNLEKHVIKYELNGQICGIVTQVGL